MSSVAFRPLSGSSSTRLVVDHLTDARGSRFNQGGIRFDLDLFGHLGRPAAFIPTTGFAPTCRMIPVLQIRSGILGGSPPTYMARSADLFKV